MIKSPKQDSCFSNSFLHIGLFSLFNVADEIMLNCTKRGMVKHNLAAGFFVAANRWSLEHRMFQLIPKIC